jgi:hypothetical protein
MEKRDKEPNKKRRLTFRTYGSDWWPCMVTPAYRKGYTVIYGEEDIFKNLADKGEEK